MNRVLEEYEHFMDQEYRRLCKSAFPDKSPEKYFMAELIMLRARLQSLKAKYGYEN